MMILSNGELVHMNILPHGFFSHHLWNISHAIRWVQLLPAASAQPSIECNRIVRFILATGFSIVYAAKGAEIDGTRE